MSPERKMKICREEKKGKPPLQKKTAGASIQAALLAAQAPRSAVSEEAALTKPLLISCTAKPVPCAIPAESVGRCRFGDLFHRLPVRNRLQVLMYTTPME